MDMHVSLFVAFTGTPTLDLSLTGPATVLSGCSISWAMEVSVNFWTPLTMSSRRTGSRTGQNTAPPSRVATGGLGEPHATSARGVHGEHVTLST